jgi:translation initiation factor RLI1
VDPNFRVCCILASHSLKSAYTSIDYFTKVLEDNLKAVVKPQYVDQIPRAVKGPVKEVGPLIDARSQMDNMDHIMDVLGSIPYPTLNITEVANRPIRA